MNQLSGIWKTKQTNICGLLLTLNDLLFLVDVSSDVGIFGVLSAIKKERKISKK